VDVYDEAVVDVSEAVLVMDVVEDSVLVVV
jgi:hypothetical protein